MLSLDFIAALVGVFAAAVLAHELTHYLVARTLGIRAWFASPTSVAYEIDEDRPLWQYRVVGLSPQLMALPLATVLWVAHDGLLLRETVIAACGIGLYSWGSIEDLSIRAARGETPLVAVYWQRLDGDEQAAYIGGFGTLLAAIIGTIFAAISPAASVVGMVVGAGVLFGSIGSAALTAYH